MPNHTPGPWRKFPHLDSDGGQSIIDGDGSRIALVSCRTKTKRGQAHTTVCPERDANTALIAAAPEMAALLRRLITNQEEAQDGRMARAALREDGAIIEEAAALLARLGGADHA